MKTIPLKWNLVFFLHFSVCLSAFNQVNPTKHEQLSISIDSESAAAKLFEALLYRQFNDTSADYQSSYDIAFSIAFDETGYFVGYEMARQITKHKGNQAIANLLTSDPIRFTIDYINLYKSLPDDKSFIRFSKSFEDIVSKLTPLENKV